MATEAQRLIALSLGKIASCRGQRGGANLCKSLLVSQVLHNARTQYMMENFENLVKNRKENIARDNRDSFLKRDEMIEDSDNESETETAGTTEATPCVLTEATSEVNKENSPPCSTVDSLVSEEEMDLSEEESFSTVSEKPESCGKCTKRRLSDAGQVGDDESTPTKKVRYDSQTQTDNDNTTTKDTTQITNLLQQFNSGLSCLLTEQDLNKDSTDNQTHSTSHESISCSTQIKEAFEALSRPSIALTV